MSLVNWNQIQKPKEAGGLSAGDIIIKNSALLFKWWGRFSKEEWPLWKNVVTLCNGIQLDQSLVTQNVKQN